MQIINISSDASQQQNVVLPDGTSVLIRVQYMPQQLGWFFLQIKWGTFNLYGMRITNNPNMLRQWKNILPFGFACQTDGKREPTQQQDFSSGASVLYLLSASEVEAYETFLQEN